MNHKPRCGSFLRCTGWASHLLGPPWCFSLQNSSIEQKRATHIPLERRGAGMAGICAPSSSLALSSSLFALPSLSFALPLSGSPIVLFSP